MSLEAQEQKSYCYWTAGILLCMFFRTPASRSLRRHRRRTLASCILIPLKPTG
ncbi:hypothetical protein BJX70DRAFT_378528 [Aspergillus crustosus]